MRERIAMTRALCIGCMIYVHVPGNAIVTAVDGVPWLSTLAQGMLIEGPGRASAALLSLVSGILTAIALTRATPASLYRRRFRSIIVPMLIWSGTTVALYALLSLVRPTFLQLDGSPTPFESVLHYVNSVTFLTEQPYGPTLHLGFLRDLFVCILLAPLLLALLRRAAPLVLVALAVLYLLDVQTVVVLRPLVVFAFTVGLWLSERDARLDALDAAWPLWVALSVATTALIVAMDTVEGLGSAQASWFAAHGMDLRETLLFPLSRLFGALAVWSLTAKLVGTASGRRLTRLSPYVFVAFCSHFLALTLLWEGVLRPLMGSSAHAAYLPWFVLAPFVAMGCAVIIVELTARVWPACAALLTGGRAGGRAGKGRDGVIGAVGDGAADGAADETAVSLPPSLPSRSSSRPHPSSMACSSLEACEPPPRVSGPTGSPAARRTPREERF